MFGEVRQTFCILFYLSPNKSASDWLIGLSTDVHETHVLIFMHIFFFWCWFLPAIPTIAFSITLRSPSSAHNIKATQFHFDYAIQWAAKWHLLLKNVLSPPPLPSPLLLPLVNRKMSIDCLQNKTTILKWFVLKMLEINRFVLRIMVCFVFFISSSKKQKNVQFQINHIYPYP